MPAVRAVAAPASEVDVRSASVPAAAPATPSTEELFARVAAGDTAARDALLVQNLPLVRHVVGQMARRLAVRVEYDELISAGTVGLIQAVDAFDAGRGIAFSTFAAPRIRGAVIDELRRHDHATRTLRRKERDVAAALRTLVQRLGRSPSDAELAAHLDVSVETVWRWRHEAEGATIGSIDAPASGRRAGEPSQPVSLVAMLAAPSSEAPDAQLDRAETLATLRDAILQLKAQERTVLAMYYFEELPMKAIAPVLNVTESRVCQIHKKALHALRAAVATQLDRAA